MMKPWRVREGAAYIEDGTSNDREQRLKEAADAAKREYRRACHCRWRGGSLDGQPQTNASLGNSFRIVLAAHCESRRPDQHIREVLLRRTWAAYDCGVPQRRRHYIQVRFHR